MTVHEAFLEQDLLDLQNKVEEKEKRIADLEAKLKHAEENCINKTCVVFQDKEDCVAKLLELEKENAELKTDYEVLSCSVGDFGELQDKLEEEQRKNNGLSDNLTKAKDLLKQWVELYKPKLEGYPITPIQKQTEQFLSEVEK